MTQHFKVFSSKCLWILFLLLCLAPTTHAEELRRVGLIAPLSGPVSPHGRAVREGLKLGLQYGKCQDSIELAVEDDGFEPKRSVSAARKLFNEKKIQVLLGVGSGPTHALAPLAEQLQIPLLALAGDSSVSKGNRFTVRLRPPASYEGKRIAALANRIGTQSVAMICSSNEFTLSVCDTVSSELGAQVVFRQDVLPDDADFKTLASKIRQLAPSHVMPILMPGKVGIFARQARDAHLDAPILGGVFIESTSDLEAANGALIGAKYVMPDVREEFTHELESLRATYPGSIAWGAIFFDVGRIICAARAQSQNILSYIQSLKAFPGSPGPIDFRSEDGDQYFSYPYIEKEITRSGFVRWTR